MGSIMPRQLNNQVHNQVQSGYYRRSHRQFQIVLKNDDLSGVDRGELQEFLSAQFKKVVATNIIDFGSENESVKEDLYKILVNYYPKVNVYTYGSRELGTGTETSDLDIYVDIDESYYIHGLDVNKGVDDVLQDVEQILKANSDVWDFKAVVKAKVPIIKVVHKRTKISCDLSFSDGLAHSNTALIKFFCNKNLLLLEMIVFLGQWLDLSEELSNKMNKYTLRLLIIYYLQCNSLLPSIKSLQDDIHTQLKIGEWNVDYNKKAVFNQTLTNANDLHYHVQRFFKFYSQFERFNGVLSTYVGAVLPKTAFDSGKTEILQAYYNFVRKYGKHQEYVFSPMNVQGPFNLADNPAKRISQNTLKIFIDLSRASYHILNSM